MVRDILKMERMRDGSQEAERRKKENYDISILPTKNPFFTKWSYVDSRKSAEGPNTLLEIIYPLLWTWRLLGRFPYQREGRNVRSRIFSLWGLYSAIVITTITAFEIREDMPTEEEDLQPKSFNSRFQTAMSYVFYFCTLCITITILFQLPKEREFFERWIHLEESLENQGIILRTELKMKKYRPLLICLLLSSLLGGIDFYVSDDILSRIISGATTFFVNLNCLLIFAVWFQKNRALIKTANILSKHFKQMLSKTLVNREMVVNYRQIWLQLSQLYLSLGRNFGAVFLVVLLLFTIVGLHAAYTLIVIFKLGPSEEISTTVIVALLVTLAFSISLIYGIAELGQQCSNQIGAQFQYIILQENLMKFDKETEYELDLFLKTIAREYPSMLLGGYVQVDRRLFVSILSTCVTYLIVLVQFQASDEAPKSQANETAIRPTMSTPS